MTAKDRLEKESEAVVYFTHPPTQQRDPCPKTDSHSPSYNYIQSRMTMVPSSPFLSVYIKSSFNHYYISIYLSPSTSALRTQILSIFQPASAIPSSSQKRQQFPLTPPSVLSIFHFTFGTSPNIVPSSPLIKFGFAMPTYKPGQNLFSNHVQL